MRKEEERQQGIKKTLNQAFCIN